MKSQLRKSTPTRNPITNESSVLYVPQEAAEKKNYLKKNQSMMNFQSTGRYEKGSAQNLEYDVFPLNRENLKKRVEGLKSGIDLHFNEEKIIRQNQQNQESQQASQKIPKSAKDRIMDKMHGQQVSNIIAYNYAPTFRDNVLSLL